MTGNMLDKLDAVAIGFVQVSRARIVGLPFNCDVSTRRRHVAKKQIILAGNEWGGRGNRVQISLNFWNPWCRVEQAKLSDEDSTVTLCMKIWLAWIWAYKSKYGLALSFDKLCSQCQTC